MWILCCAQTHFLSPRLYKNLVSQLEIWICLIVPFHPVLWSWKFCMGVPVCFVCVHEYITGIWKWGEIEEVSRTWIIEMWYTVYDSLWRNVMYYCRFCVSRVGLKYQKTICIWHQWLWKWSSEKLKNRQVLQSLLKWYFNFSSWIKMNCNQDELSNYQMRQSWFHCFNLLLPGSLFFAFVQECNQGLQWKCKERTKVQ